MRRSGMGWRISCSIWNAEFLVALPPYSRFFAACRLRIDRLPVACRPVGVHP